jgi:hypothetical protein
MATITHDPNVAKTIIKVGREMGATKDQMLAAFATALAESEMTNVNHGDRDSLGVFQQRPSQGWGTPSQVRDVEYAARKFFEAAKKVGKYDSVPMLAQKVQRSAFADGSNYQARLADASLLLQQYQAPSGWEATAVATTGQMPTSQQGVQAHVEQHATEELADDEVLQLVLGSMSDRLKASTTGDEDDEVGEVETTTADAFGKFGDVDVAAEQGERRAMAASRSEAEAAVEQPLFVPPTGGGGAMEWGGFQNGRIPLDQMVALTGLHHSGTATHYFEPNAAKAMQAMVAAAKADGVTIRLTDSYRDFATQQRLRAEKGHQVATATPGTSIHGWGKAIDVAGDAARKWIQQNGAQYGWIWPEWAQRQGSKSYEPWHFEYRPSPSGVA